MAFEEYCFQLNRFHELFSPLLLYDCLIEENLKKKILTSKKTANFSKLFKFNKGCNKLQSELLQCFLSLSNSLSVNSLLSLSYSSFVSNFRVFEKYLNLLKIKQEKLYIL